MRGVSPTYCDGKLLRLLVQIAEIGWVPTMCVPGYFLDKIQCPSSPHHPPPSPSSQFFFFSQWYKSVWLFFFLSLSFFFFFKLLFIRFWPGWVCVLRGLCSHCGAWASHRGGSLTVKHRCVSGVQQACLGRAGFSSSCCGLSSCSSWTLENSLNSYGVRAPLACGIFPGQGLNPCLPH